MNKVDLKARIQKSIREAPHRESIKRVSLFGSRAYGEPRPDSDVDLLIEFEKGAPIGLFEMCSLENYFTDALENKVDLRTPQEISRYFREEVVAKAEPIYEK